MNYVILLVLFLLSATLRAQRTFEYQEGDTTYLMQEYFMVFLNAGPERGQDSTSSARFQEQHQAHLERMAQEGHLSIVGPFGDAGDPRGICIYHTATLAEADSLAKLDPAVKAGRLSVEVRPWWGTKGSSLK